MKITISNSNARSLAFKTPSGLIFVPPSGESDPVNVSEFLLKKLIPVAGITISVFDEPTYDFVSSFIAPTRSDFITQADSEVTYVPVGAIAAIDPVGVTYDDEVFTVPYGTTSFTFTDDAVDMSGELIDGEWVFSEV